MFIQSNSFFFKGANSNKRLNYTIKVCDGSVKAILELATGKHYLLNIIVGILTC